MHHVDCAYINSPEKVDDSCSWSARSILQLLRQLIKGPGSIGQRPGRTFETCMIYELEKMWTSESTQFAWIWQISQLMGKEDVTFVEHFTSGNQQQAMVALRPIHQTAPHSLTYLPGMKNDYHCRTWVHIFSGFVWRHPFHLKEPNPSA